MKIAFFHDQFYFCRQHVAFVNNFGVDLCSRMSARLDANFALMKLGLIDLLVLRAKFGPQ